MLVSAQALDGEVFVIALVHATSHTVEHWFPR
jgi:hypothetical protein